MMGLLIATLTRQRVGQVFLSVAFIAGLFMAFWMAMLVASGMIGAGYSWIGDDGFWAMNVVLLTLYATTFALAFFAAAGMISFPSENRSTSLRICMALQQAAFVGIMGYFWVKRPGFDTEAVLVMAILVGAYWYVMGALLTSEQPEMSQRVKRSLPSSFLGRVFLTWFSPGPGTGYLFAVAIVSSILVVGLTAMAIAEFSGTRAGWPSGQEVFYFLVISWGYLVAYLGLGLIVVSALRRVVVVTMLACVLINFLLVLAGSGIPLVVQMMSVELRYSGYTYLQIANPFWSLYHVANGGVTEGQRLAITVPTAAVCMLLLNLRRVVQELHQVRVAPPTRVVEDEAELHPPPAARPQSPWDE
jgi:hypothetical protein